jgi:hypothetical protein
MSLEELGKLVPKQDKKPPKYKDLLLLIESEEKLLLKLTKKIDILILKNL